MSRIKISTEDWVKRAKEIHGDRWDYSLTVYKNSRSKVTIICPEHGKFSTIASNHIHVKSSCPKCGTNKKLTKDEEIAENSKFKTELTSLQIRVTKAPRPPQEYIEKQIKLAKARAYKSEIGYKIPS